MGKGKHKRQKDKGGKLTVWVCRGCCCGTEKKHPGVPHRRLLRLVKQRGTEAGAKVKVTDCLGPCGQGNVVVVRAGRDIRWFRKMNDEQVTADLMAHVASGAPLRTLPGTLERRVLRKRDGRKPT